MVKSKKSKIFTLLFVFICVIIYTSLCFSLREAHSGAYSYSRSELEDKLYKIALENKRLDGLIATADKGLYENGELLSLYAAKINAEAERLDYYNSLLYSLESDIAQRDESLKLLEAETLQKESLIAQSMAEIEELDRQNQESLKSFSDMIVRVYKSGAVTNTVMNSFALYDDAKSFSDMAIGHKTSQNVSKQSLEFMNALLERIKEQEQRQEALSLDLADLESARVQAALEYDELLIDRRKLQKTANECKTLSENYKRLYDKYYDDIKELETAKNNYRSLKTINRTEADEFERQLAALIAREQGSRGLMGGGWRRPLDSRFRRITTYFGYDSWRDGQHNGLDIAGDKNNDINFANIYAVRDGIVIAANKTYIQGYSYGKYIAVDHGGGYVSLYAHCNDIYVAKGQSVSGGQVIGAVGSTGWSTGPHLHFEIRKDGAPQDPMSFIDF